MPQIDPKMLFDPEKIQPLNEDQQHFLDARQMRTIDEPLPQIGTHVDLPCSSCGRTSMEPRLIRHQVFPQFSDTPVLCERCILAFVSHGAIRIPMVGEDPSSLEMAIENGGVAIGGTAFAWS